MERTNHDRTWKNERMKEIIEDWQSESGRSCCAGNEEDRMPKKIFTQELEEDEKKGKTQEKMERLSRKRSSSAGNEKMERTGGR